MAADPSAAMPDGFDLAQRVAVPLPGMAPVWSVRLLGAVEAHAPGRSLVHWPSRAAAALLARLALAPDRNHPREELIELLWPGVALDVGRNRLRQTLSTLKGLLEVGAAAPVLQADRMAVRAVPGALACDAANFERWLRAGDTERARQAYRGELMPGFYNEWVIDERRRLSTLFEHLDALPLLPASPRRDASPEALRPTAGQLPNFWTCLFGVEHNATRVRELIRHQRLVTLFGPGGSGKTRLAVEAARALQTPAGWAPQGNDDGPAFDRIAFVSLVDCTDVRQAIAAVASALGIVGHDPLARIARVLAGQRTLLVLDNLEQLVGQVDAMLLQLLTDTATLHLLVTSRQRLALDGEHVFELAGLLGPTSAAPGAPGNSTVEAASSQPAVALFVDRARAVRADFALGAANGAAVCELVQQLAGMPLAIELAASRMRSLSPQALLALLAEGDTPMLDLLARGSAGPSLAQRHASMRHVVDWSWRQLSPPLIELLGALATFAAPALVDTVAAAAGLDLRTARERLDLLRDSSLVVSRQDERGRQRCVLLQPVREFVQERTDAAAAATTRDRLRHWLIEFGRRCAALGHRAIDEVEAEVPLIHAAILAGVADGAYTQAAQIAVGLRRHWEVDTRAGLPLSIMQALQAALPELRDSALRSDLCALLSFTSSMAGLASEALALANAALEHAPDPQRRARALQRWCSSVTASGKNLQAVDVPLGEALHLARQVGDLELEGLILRTQFLVTVNRDDDNLRGEALAAQAQAVWERLGHRRNAYGGLMDRASCWIELGRCDEAATALAACEQVARQERYATGYITAAWQLGRVLVRQRQGDAALAAFQRCVHGAWQHNRPIYVADALVLVPMGLTITGQCDAAARVLGFAVPNWQRQSGDFYPELERDVRFTRRLLLHALGPMRLEALRIEGSSLTLPEAVALALGNGRP